MTDTAPDPREADQVVKLAQAWAQAERKGDTSTLVKASIKLLVLVWKRLPRNKRETFLGCLDFGSRDFVPLPNMPEILKRDMELTRILSDWDQVARSLTDEDAKGFALSVLKMRQKAHWKPTEKQEAYIRSLHAAWARGEKDTIPADMEVVE